MITITQTCTLNTNIARFILFVSLHTMLWWWSILLLVVVVAVVVVAVVVVVVVDVQFDCYVIVCLRASTHTHTHTERHTQKDTHRKTHTDCMTLGYDTTS